MLDIVHVDHCVKRTYTKPSAKKAVKALKAQGDHDIIPYRCDSCGWWHLGHPSKYDRLKRRGLA